MQAERHRRFPLAARDGANGAPENLRLIGGGIERERQDAAEEGVAKQPPYADGVEERPELAAAVVDEEHLGEQRRAAEEVDVSVGDGPYHAVPGIPGERDRQGKQGPDRNRDRDELDRHHQPFEHARPVAREKVEIHAARLMPRSDQRSIPAMPKEEMIDRIR